jgi:hypothetical protein
VAIDRVIECEREGKGAYQKLKEPLQKKLVVVAKTEQGDTALPVIPEPSRILMGTAMC